MISLHLTSAPSRRGWNRRAETEAMLAYNGEGSLLAYLENRRLPQPRNWICHDLIDFAQEPASPMLADAA